MAVLLDQQDIVVDLMVLLLILAYYIIWLLLPYSYGYYGYLGINGDIPNIGAIYPFCRVLVTYTSNNGLSYGITQYRL